MCKALTPEYVNTASGSEIHRFKWLEDDSKIGELPLEWNWLVSEYDDTTTMAYEACENAIRMAQIRREEIECIHVGAEFRPYKVHPIALDQTSSLILSHNPLQSYRLYF